MLMLMHWRLCMLRLFAEKQKDMWLLASDWLATPVFATDQGKTILL